MINLIPISEGLTVDDTPRAPPAAKDAWGCVKVSGS
jgi:hypothetical protein